MEADFSPHERGVASGVAEQYCYNSYQFDMLIQRKYSFFFSFLNSSAPQSVISELAAALGSLLKIQSLLPHLGLPESDIQVSLMLDNNCCVLFYTEHFIKHLMSTPF